MKIPALYEARFLPEPNSDVFQVKNPALQETTLLDYLFHMLACLPPCVVELLFCFVLFYLRYIPSPSLPFFLASLKPGGYTPGW